MGRKILGDGKRRHSIDLLFAHDAHGLGAELIGMIDGGDTSMSRIESSGLAGAMNAHARSHARRLLSRGFELGLRVLVGSAEFAIGNLVFAGFIDLDERRA